MKIGEDKLEILRSWKKVFENDLPSIVSEVKDLVSLPAVIILTGPVGAGKTTFTKLFVESDNQVTSPTYSIVNEAGKMAHADLYRIEGDDDVIHLELELYLEDKDFFLVEWGKPYLNVLHKIIDEDFLFYELEISVNQVRSDGFAQESRNLDLKSL